MKTQLLSSMRYAEAVTLSVSRACRASNFAASGITICVYTQRATYILGIWQGLCVSLPHFVVLPLS